MTQPSKVAQMAASLMRSSGLEKFAQDLVEADFARRAKVADATPNEAAQPAKPQTYVDERGTTRTTGGGPVNRAGNWAAGPGWHNLAAPAAGTAAAAQGGRMAVGFGAGVSRGLVGGESVAASRAAPYGSLSNLAARAGKRLVRSRSAEAIGQGLTEGFMNRGRGALQQGATAGSEGGLQAGARNFAETFMKKTPAAPAAAADFGEGLAGAAGRAAESRATPGVFKPVQRLRAGVGLAEQAAGAAERTVAPVAERAAGRVLPKVFGGVAGGLGLLASSPLQAAQGIMDDSASVAGGQLENRWLANRQPQPGAFYTPTGQLNPDFGKTAPAPAPAPASVPRTGLFRNR